MNEQAILGLVDAFFGKDFSFPQAHRLLGPAQREMEDRIVLAPPARLNLEQAILERVKPQPDAAASLAGISLRFATPLQVDFRVIAEKLGPSQEVPRLKPDQPVTYRFSVRSAAWDGYLILGATEATDAPKRDIKTLIVRRFPAAAP